jgi:hypothetical protein
MKMGLSRSKVVSCVQTDGRKDEALFSPVAVHGYRHRNRTICSFSFHNTHVDELRGILQEHTGMNRIREEEGENIKH